MPTPPRIDRRQALKWFATAAVSIAYLRSAGVSLGGAEPSSPAVRGFGTDPKLTINYKPGDVWPLTLTDTQRDLTALLCDVIIPADAESPSASSVHVHDFIDEWISAPYPTQRADRETILNGLAWLETESKARFEAEFRDLTDDLRRELCDDICLVSKAPPALVGPARFFARFRDLTAGGYYTTPQGMKALGYAGNVPSPNFDGPPDDVLRRLGLA